MADTDPLAVLRSFVADYVPDALTHSPSGVVMSGYIVLMRPGDTHVRFVPAESDEARLVTLARAALDTTKETPMPDLFKATRPDGRDFRPATIDYAAALASGEVIRHPAPKRVKGDAGTYLSVSVSPADCTGMVWPCRLFRVEAIGRAIKDPDLPSKRGVSALRVVEELPAWQALGPNGEEVARLIESCRTITPEQARQLDAARYAAGCAAPSSAAWDAAWAAARDAARYAAWAGARDAAPSSAARDAAWAAAGALVVRDLITPAQFDTLTGPWVSVMGRTWEVTTRA